MGVFFWAGLGRGTGDGGLFCVCEGPKKKNEQTDTVAGGGGLFWGRLYS
jgi:hypothetical protein